MVLIRTPRSAARGYAYDIAPDGQTVAHAPQPAHRFGLTFTWSPSWLMAPVEQTSMHALQPVLRLRPWAQSLSL